MEKRIETIDIVKAIGLFLVILGHLVQVNSVIFRYIFSFHMPVFFFVSGMCFSYQKHNSFFEFLKDKTKKRIVPYLFFVLLGTIISLLITKWRINLFNINVMNLLKQIFYYTQPEQIHVGQVWFLVALFFAEIILYIINKLFDKFERNKILMILIYLLLIILGNKISIISNIILGDRLPFKIDVAIIACVFMGLGYELKKNKIHEKIQKIKYKNLYIFIFFIVGFFIAQYNGYVNICNCIYNNIILYMLASFSGIACIYIISEKISKNEYLEFYGKNSLFIFGIHSFFISIFEYIISIMYSKEMIALINIPDWLCLIGSIAIFIIIFPITMLYNKKIRKNSNNKINNNEHKKCYKLISFKGEKNEVKIR